MRHIKFEEPDPENCLWYKSWKEKADIERQKAIDLIEKDDEYTFVSAIWAGIKDYLKGIFYDKCAYCEVKIGAGAYGDIDHFRPKGTPKNAQNGHRGYYWLAYDLKNLVLSCQKCNQGGGKVNQFPVDGWMANGPADDPDNEDALLLNPYNDKLHPEDHLSFTPPIFVPDGDPVFIGTVEPVILENGAPSKYGKATIKVCKLNRDDLIRERQSAQGKYLSVIGMALIREDPGDVIRDLKKSEFSAAKKVVLEKVIEFYEENLKR